MVDVFYYLIRGRYLTNCIPFPSVESTSIHVAEACWRDFQKWVALAAQVVVVEQPFLVGCIPKTRGRLQVRLKQRCWGGYSWLWFESANLAERRVFYRVGLCGVIIGWRTWEYATRCHKMPQERKRWSLQECRWWSISEQTRMGRDPTIMLYRLYPRLIFSRLSIKKLQWTC